MRNILTIFLLLIAPTLFADTIAGKVVAVTDGDTVKVLTADKQEVKVRLFGIDAPEKAQDYGQKAKQFTSGLIFGKEVRVEVEATDRYKRSVGLIYLGDMLINAELVKEGFAWVYPQYCKKQPLCGNMKALEEKARQDKKGLWAMPAPTPPWEWRKDKKKHKTETIEDESDLYRDILKKKDEAVDKVKRDAEQEEKAKKQQGMEI